MSLFAFLGSIFKPAADLIDELHVSDEERGILKNKFAEIEARVSIKTLELQQLLVESNSKIAIAEQKHGNWYVKSVRPTISLGCFCLLVLTGFEIIPYKELIIQISGMYLGFYGGLRTFEKVKKGQYEI